MTPSDKDKFEKAYRIWMNKNPDADKEYDGWTTEDGSPMTARKHMEISLASGAVFDGIDNVLKNDPKMTLDDLIQAYFDIAPEELKAPPPPRPNRRSYKF